jgi:hypothetical protein
MRSNGIEPIIGIYGSLDEEFAFLLETELIDKLGRRDLNKGPLLNLTNGGQGSSGNIRSVETRKKIGQANIGKNRTHTPESRLKISKSCLGRKDSVESKNLKSKANIGENNNNSKLTNVQIVEIFLSSENNHFLSRKFNVSEPHIWAIKKQKYWKSITKNLVSQS